MTERALILTPDRNVVKKDYTNAFKPESLRLQSVLASEGIAADVRRINVGKPRVARGKEVLQLIADRWDLTFVAFLCHGVKQGLQLGPLDSEFADALGVAIAEASKANKPLHVVFYACSAGKRESGFCQHVFDGLVRGSSTSNLHRARLDVETTLDAHTTVGHTTRNPFVRRWTSGVDVPSYLVPPPPKNALAGTRADFAKWKKLLWSSTDLLRFEFPRMTQAQVQARLSSSAPRARSQTKGPKARARALRPPRK